MLNLLVVVVCVVVVVELSDEEELLDNDDNLEELEGLELSKITNPLGVELESVAGLLLLLGLLRLKIIDYYFHHQKLF